MEDELFDNGIDGTQFEDPTHDDFLMGIYEDGGTIIHYDREMDLQVIYFCGQWNDSGVDPDSIMIRLEQEKTYEKGYSVRIDKDRVYFYLPDKHFDIEAKLHLTDFIDIESPFPIEIYKVNISDLQDAISEKKIKVNFDREKFLARIERFKNLLVFG